MKGVILAGGSGTRLRPLTTVVGKQLLPVYDKPMIYYPLSTLILAEVKELLLITTPVEISRFESLLGDGSAFGVEISYAIQDRPLGPAHGVQLAEEFTSGDSFWFILGDNLFHGQDFGLQLAEVARSDTGAHIFTYRVADPSQYGVIRFSDEGDDILEIVEKPKEYISSWAIPGLYLFDGSAAKRTREIVPSKRGELEIADLLENYRKTGELTAHKVSRGNAWFDLGTPESLLVGSEFVHLVQSRQGMLVGSPEEAAFRRGFLTSIQITNRFAGLGASAYESSVLNVIRDCE